MLAAARYAQGAQDCDPPPPELSLAFNCQKWGVLPDAGGLRDQRAGIVNRMTAAMNVYEAYSALARSKSLKEWQRNNPAQYALWAKVEEMRNGAD